MKSLNVMKFVAQYSKEMAIALDKIENAADYETAKKLANYAFGFLDGMVMFTNAMICKENNDFTGEMSDVEDDWRADIYQAVANVALKTQQSSDEVLRLLTLRDECKD